MPDGSGPITSETRSGRTSAAETAGFARTQNGGGAIGAADGSVRSMLSDLALRSQMSASADLASRLVRKSSSRVSLRPEPHRFATFHVLRRAQAPAVLFEAGYISNADDEVLLRSPEQRSKIALALARAADHLRVHPEQDALVVSAELCSLAFHPDLEPGNLMSVLNDDINQMERFLNTLGTIASVSPLLGLLGTVFGMIQMFLKILVTGVGDVNQLAGGIGQALISTAGGLCVAIPAVMFHRYFRGVIAGYVVEMEKQAIALLDTIDEGILPAAKPPGRARRSEA